MKLKYILTFAVASVSVWPMTSHAWIHGLAFSSFEGCFSAAGAPFSAPWGFEHVRVHDLKHTFGRRLRAAGVGEETRKVLLGHTNRDITTHYSAVDIAELINAVNKIDRSLATPDQPTDFWSIRK